MAKFNPSKIMKDTEISPNTVSKFQFPALQLHATFGILARVLG